jgi:hypothetical protein
MEMTVLNQLSQKAGLCRPLEILRFLRVHLKWP